MKARHRAILMIAAIAIATPPALAGLLGEPAPALSIAAWVKGDPVVLEEGKGKNLYLVEIWATTCPHSRASIPHLTELQKKYEKDNVILIAVSGEEVEAVKAFVEKMGPKIGYRVAVDQDRVTGRTYMGSLEVPTMPHAFLIDKTGKVVWHGHPMSRIGNIIDEVLAGTYDIERSRRSEQARTMMAQYLQMVRSPGKARKAAVLGAKVIEYGREDMLLLNDFAWTIAMEAGLIRRDFDLAMRAAQAAYDACEGKVAQVVDTYARVLFESGKKEEAIKYQEQAVKLAEGQEVQKELVETLEKYKKAVAGD